ncbi:MAG: hypothetical protein H6536_01555 [Bacteroidales bacterium]|nr:hypothetical protein [Bacteroidales bacterium]
MFKPSKILLFLCFIMLTLLTIAWLVPMDGIEALGLKFRFPNIAKVRSELMGNMETQNHELIGKHEKQPTPDSTQTNRSQTISDSLKINGDSVIANESPNKLSLNLLLEKVTPIEYADSSKAALKSFFQALTEGHSQTGQIRVMHFGDSQIEGDRVTMFIRSALQAKFGGSGVGIIPGYPQSYQPLNVQHSVSGDWSYTSLHDGGNEVSQFGLLGGITQIDDGSNGEAIELKKIGKKSRSNQFKRLRIFYGQNDSTYLMELEVNNQIEDAEMLPRMGTIAEHRFSIPESSNSLELQFNGKGPLTVYGVSMESDRGIYVDNIPQRGSSGAVFTKFNVEFSKKIFDLLNVKLVILQYGVNVVPGNLNSYNYYEEILYRQIKAIKAFKPDVSVLMIGVSDMSRKNDDKFESYPSIEKVRDAQRNAAFRAGAAFWDCYAAMGGKNSMPEWVNANPSLASKDFTHFNFRGSKLIAEMFLASLMDEYAVYQSKKTN